MSKFKVGDRVRALRDDMDVRKGAIYAITRVFDSGDVWIKDDVDMDNRMTADSIEHTYTSCAAAEVDNLADEYGWPKATAKFREGDMVRVVRHCNWRGSEIKMGVPVGEVREIVRKTAQLANEGIDSFSLDGDDRYFYTPLNLEHVAVAPATATGTTALHIEAGKLYKTRDGRKVGPMVRAARGYDQQYPFTVDHYFKSGYGTAWRADGTFHPDVGEKDDADLIAEWSDEPVAAAPKFKVGDRVKQKGWRDDYWCTVTHINGSTITIKDDNGNSAPYDNLADFIAAPTTIADIVAKHSQSGTAIVAVLENGQPRPATRPYVHATASAADAEANRLARTNPGKEFGVYTLGAVAKVERVYEHEWQRLAAGGERVRAICNLRDAAGLHYDGAKAAVDSWLMRAA